MKCFITLAILFGPVLPARAEESLAELVAKVSSVASSGSGMDEAEQKLSEKLAPHGTAAADLLIPLLKSENEDVRQLAGYCVLDLPPGALLERHLPALMEACEKERGWLPNAIADIESEEAVAFLAKEFRKKPQTQAQIDNALIRTCPRSITPLLRPPVKMKASFSMASPTSGQKWAIRPHPRFLCFSRWHPTRMRLSTAG